MRLTDFQRHALKQAAMAQFGPGVQVRLFGSRLDDQARGGDIDLLVDTPLADPAQVAAAHTRFVAAVCAALGEQKLDVLVDYPGRQNHPPIFALAREQGVRL